MDVQAAFAIDFDAEVLIQEACDPSCFLQPRCFPSQNSGNYLDALVVDVGAIIYILVLSMVTKGYVAGNDPARGLVCS